MLIPMPFDCFVVLCGLNFKYTGNTDLSLLALIFLYDGAAGLKR